MLDSPQSTQPAPKNPDAAQARPAASRLGGTETDPGTPGDTSGGLRHRGRLRGLGLRGRLYGLVAVTVLPSVLLIATWLVIDLREHRQLAELAAQRGAAHALAAFGQHEAAAGAVLGLLRETRPEGGQAPDPHRVARLLESQPGSIRFVAFSDREGWWLVRREGDRVVRARPGALPLGATQHTASATPLLLGPVANPLDGHPSLLASQDGRVVGVDIDSLTRAMQAASHIDSARVELSCPPTAYPPTAGSGGVEQIAVASRGSAGEALRVTLPIAGRPMCVRFEVPKGTAQVSSQSGYATAFLAAIMLTLLLGGASGIYLARTHRAEVRRLRDQVRSFASDDTTARQPLPLEGELGELGDAFHRMAEKIEAQRDELCADRELRMRLSRDTVDWLWEQDDAFRYTRFQCLADASRAGLAPQTVLGKRPWELDCENMTSAMWKAHQALLQARRPFRNLILHWRKPDGSTPVIRLGGDPQFDSAGTFIGYTGTGVDITHAVQAESAVAEAEKRWVAALEGAGHGVWDWDRRNQRIFRSRTWGAMLGLGAETDLQDPGLWSRLVHPDDLAAANAAMDAHIERRTERYHVEVRMLHADGSWRWMLDRGMATEFDAYGTPTRFIGTQTDVTAEKATALALRESEARLRLILDHAPNVAIQGFDAAGRVRYWNRPAERIFGWTAAEADGRTLDELFLDADQARSFLDELKGIAGSGVVMGPEETRVRHKSGDERWVLSNLFEIPPTADGVRFICMDVDITATKRAELKRAESERQLESIFMNAAMPTMIADIGSRTILRVNRAFERALEIGDNEAIGRKLSDFNVWEDPATPDRLYSALAEQGRLSGVEVRMRSRSGRMHDMLLFVDVIALAGRDAIIAQVLDITLQKQASARLEEATRWARTLVDYSPSIMMLSRWQDGVIVEVNDAACAVLERSRAELIGAQAESVVDWAEPGDRAAMEAALDARGALSAYPIALRCRSGSLRRLNLYCELIVKDDEIYVLSQAIDVTELSQIQDALAESEQRMKTLFMHGPVPMLLADAESKAIIQANPALERAIGIPNDALVGKSLFELGFWADPNDRVRMYERLAESGRVEGMETRFRAPSGELLDYQISVEVIPYGGRRAIIAHGFDVTANRRVLDEAERSRRWFRTLFELSPISMTILDMAGRTIIANAACAKMYGMPLDQIIGRTSEENNLWVTPGDRCRLWETLQEQGSVRDVVLARRRADGRPLKVLAYMDRFEIDGESYFITQGIDVTRAHESERALRALTALNSAAFNAVGESIVVHDRSGQVILVNAMADQVLGAAGRSPLGATLLEPEFHWLGVDGSPAAAVALPFRLARESGQAVREQVVGLRLPPAAGRTGTRWFSVSCEPFDRDGEGAPEGTVTSFFDITDRVQAEAEQRVLLDRLQLQLERMPIACFLTDKDFNVTFWNPAAARTFGHLPEQIIGRSADLLTPAPMRSTVRELVRGTLGSAAGVDFRNENITRTGECITCEWRSNSLFGADGKFVATMHMAIDMTEVIDSQRRLERLNEDLEQRVADRTAELSLTVRELEQFSYTVAHDLRAPLRALDAYSHLLAEGGPDADAFLTRIRTNIQHMSGLIDGLLNYGRVGRQVIQLQTVDMNRVCDVVVADLQQAYPKAHIDIGPMASVQGDDTLLRQVWTNLVGNACKFSAGIAAPRVRLSCAEGENGAVRFSVQDNGVGFDMQYANKLFGVFERLHRQDDFAGSGIGLSIVKRIIERHGGKVGVESALGQGATFWFELPAEHVIRDASAD